MYTCDTCPGCYKDGVTEQLDLRSMSRIYLLILCVLIINYHILHSIGWLLRAIMFLSLSMLILIVQPHNKSYLNVLDGLLLGLMWVSYIAACHISVFSAMLELETKPCLPLPT